MDKISFVLKRYSHLCFYYIEKNNLYCAGAKLFLLGHEESYAVVGWERRLEERSDCVHREDEADRASTCLTRMMSNDIKATWARLSRQAINLVGRGADFLKSQLVAPTGQSDLRRISPN